jgi:sporulation protein YlmC with PRC-barrel domain
MRFAELYGARVRDRDGTALGRVREVYCRDGEVTHIGIGVGALLQRLTGSGKDRRIPWSLVREVRHGEVVIGS